VVLGCKFAGNSDPRGAVFAFNPDPFRRCVSVSVPLAFGGREGHLGDDRRGPDRPDTSRFFGAAPADQEIVRTLSVSRATVRKVVRGQATEFKYERACSRRRSSAVDRSPDGDSGGEATLPKRGARSTQRLFESCAAADMTRPRQCASVRKDVAEERARVPAHAYGR